MSFALLGYGRFGCAFAGLLQQAGHTLRVFDPRAAVRGDAGHLFAAIQRGNPFTAEVRAQLPARLARVHRQLLADADDDSLAIPGPDA